MRIDETVQQYLLDAEVKAYSKHTISSYKQKLGVVVRLLDEICNVTILDLVTVLHLRQVVQHLLTQPLGVRVQMPDNGVLSVASVRAYVRVIKSFFNWCYQEELIDRSPVSRLASPKPTKRIKPTLKPEHIEKMLASFDRSTDYGFRDYVIFLLLLDTGMRLSEISQLKLSDIQGSYVKVFGKGRREREIGLHPEVGKMIWKYVHKYRHADDDETHLFMGHRGRLEHSGIHEIVKRAQSRAGLQDIKISPHVFRHTFAKMYMERGGDLFKLSREMGHSDIQITKIYLEDFNSTDARKDHTSFSPIESINLKKMFKKRKKHDDTEKEG